MLSATVTVPPDGLYTIAKRLAQTTFQWRQRGDDVGAILRRLPSVQGIAKLITINYYTAMPMYTARPFII
jgi:hypothetical protein